MRLKKFFPALHNTQDFACHLNNGNLLLAALCLYSAVILTQASKNPWWRFDCKKTAQSGTTGTTKGPSSRTTPFCFLS
jgi:hypothetical protein